MHKTGPPSVKLTGQHAALCFIIGKPLETHGARSLITAILTEKGYGQDAGFVGLSGEFIFSCVKSHSNTRTRMLYSMTPHNILVVFALLVSLDIFALMPLDFTGCERLLVALDVSTRVLMVRTDLIGIIRLVVKSS